MAVSLKRLSLLFLIIFTICALWTSILFASENEPTKEELKAHLRLAHIYMDRDDLSRAYVALRKVGDAKKLNPVLLDYVDAWHRFNDLLREKWRKAGWIDAW